MSKKRNECRVGNLHVQLWWDFGVSVWRGWRKGVITHGVFFFVETIASVCLWGRCVPEGVGNGWKMTGHEICAVLEVSSVG